MNICRLRSVGAVVSGLLTSAVAYEVVALMVSSQLLAIFAMACVRVRPALALTKVFH